MESLSCTVQTSQVTSLKPSIGIHLSTGRIVHMHIDLDDPN